MNTQVSNSFWEELQQIISRVSKGFDKDWQKRSRAIDTQFLVSFIFKLVLSKNKQGYSSIMSDLWGAADQDSCIKLPQEKPFAASSVCEARQKMPENIFTVLNESVIDHWQNSTQSITWQGHRIFAIDGSKINLPLELSNCQYQHLNNSSCTTGLLSCLYNLGDSMVYDFSLSSHLDERLSALEHINKLSLGDVVVLDRGYFSYFFLHSCSEKGVHIICRMQGGNVNQDIQKFFDSDHIDRVIDYNPSYSTKYDLKKKGYDIEFKNIKLRLIKYFIGEETYICSTTLTDENYQLNDFKELYHGRWGIEGVPQARKVLIKGLIMKCGKAVKKMVVGPPKSVVRSRLQTTLSGCY